MEPVLRELLWICKRSSKEDIMSKERTIAIVSLSVAIAISAFSIAFASPTETATDVVSLCQAAQKGNLSDADRTWAQRCVRVLTEGKKQPSPSPSISSVPSPTPTKTPPQTGFPNATNTGVPAGTVLADYTGSCTVTLDGFVIDSKLVKCNLSVRAKNVVIKNSKIMGQVGTEEATDFSYTLQDSEVDAGIGPYAAVGSDHITVLRANIHGGATSVYCYANCVIRDSYLHGQQLTSTASWHLNAFLANDNDANDDTNVVTDTAGAQTNALLTHNTLVCDHLPNSADGGCSGDVNLFGDFGTIRGVTVDGNLIGASRGISYCIYGGNSNPKPFPNATGIVIKNNVIQRGDTNKCGAFGPVTDFNINGTGNVWTNNNWDTGEPVTP
jgi:hypothetical protein